MYQIRVEIQFLIMSYYMFKIFRPKSMFLRPNFSTRTCLFTERNNKLIVMILLERNIRVIFDTLSLPYNVGNQYFSQEWNLEKYGYEEKHLRKTTPTPGRNTRIVAWLFCVLSYLLFFNINLYRNFWLEGFALIRLCFIFHITKPTQLLTN